MLLARWAKGLTLVLAMCGLAAATPALANNPEDLVIDANIFFDNDAGSYAADLGGATCPGGAYNATTLATVYFSNRTVNPTLTDPYNTAAPRWSPLTNSPALPGDPTFRVVTPSEIDPWFQDVCFAGALPYTGGVDANDWTTGWTYYNYAGGLGRTDIDTTKTAVVVSGNITTDQTWTSNNNYVLLGAVRVQNNANLYIDAGTVVLGSGVGSYLVIERGANIYAQGTRTRPIIFTSGKRWQNGQQAPADWGGVVLSGRAVANCVGGCGLTTGGGSCASEGDPLITFGGNDDTDDSGIIRYARVEYAGYELAPNNELNAWTFDAVGSGTVLEYLQGHLGSDDIFEWFGGTARCRHLVATGGADDNLDWQMGWRGYVQFAVCQQRSGIAGADAGIEADNNEFNFDCASRSNPRLSNLTLVGTGPLAGGSRGIRMRRGTAGTIVNSIVAGWTSHGLRLEDNATFENCAGVTPSDKVCTSHAAEDLVVDANLFYDNDAGSYAGDSGGALCPGGAYSVTTLATVYFDNRTLNPQLNPAVYNATAPRWDPQASSPALAGNANSRVLRASELDGWFQDVCYVGALPYTGGDDSQDWTTGWTYYNYTGGLGRTDIDTTKTAVVVNADINASTTWVNTNNYQLVGAIRVNPPAVLTIEPGTVVLGSGVGSYLVINRGAQIKAQGTRTQPIIFTSGKRWQEGQQAPADWGGVVLNGRAVANCVGGCGVTTGGGSCQSEGDPLITFGGNDDTDNSGVIRYARVEYAGYELAPNNELNAWTMNAVGSETVLEYLQGHLGSDDIFEWFGGTARCRHLVATGGADDNLDWQMGYRGFVQFAVCQQRSGIAGADAGIEADNNEFNFDCPGRSNPCLSNLTLIGTGPLAGGSRGMRLRRGTAFTIINSIVQGWSSQGMRVEDNATFANCAGTAPGELLCDQLAVGDPHLGIGGFTVMAAPNPTAGPANLSFDLPSAQRVLIQVFDITGRLVETVLDGPMSAGNHNVRWEGAGQASGMYFYSVKSDAGLATGKLVVAR